MVYLAVRYPILLTGNVTGDIMWSLSCSQVSYPGTWIALFGDLAGHPATALSNHLTI